MKRSIHIRWLFPMLFLLFLGYTSTAYAFESPCISAPYGWEYQDDSLSIAINQVSGDNCVYFVADVQIAQVSAFHTAYSESAMMPVSDFADEAGAIFAINGDDFGTHSYGVIIRNGNLLRARNTTRHMLALQQNGDMSITTDYNGKSAKAIGNSLMDSQVWQTFAFGPELVAEGKAVTINPNFDVISTRDTRLEPRTALGQISPLHYVFIVVDGRQPGYSDGISLQNLQKIFIQLGATTAMNLDGGGSAEMWFQGHILNQPSGGEERSVSDVIYF